MYAYINIHMNFLDVYVNSLCMYMYIYIYIHI